MIRLAHFSDIHITAAKLNWTLRDWFNKRYAAWFNFRWLGRRRRFGRAEDVLARLRDDLGERKPDHLVFSGDATALGFESELGRAVELLGIGSLPPGMAVPGNHDYCTRPAAASGLFERYFAPWLAGQRIDGHTYPFAQQVGPVTLIGVNSCTGNFWPWDAGGSVSAAELDRLERLLAQLPPGPRVLVTHYPVCLASGRREHVVHGLRNLPALVDVADRGGISLWLHGHRHSPYYFQQPPFAPFPVICSGSATQNGLWSYGEYTMDVESCRAVRRVYEPASGRFREGEQFEVRLRLPASRRK